jgi:hypothetical protein
VRSEPLCLALLLAILAPFAACAIDIGDVTIAGSNRVEYWFWRKSREGFLDDRFDISAYYRDLLLGLRYQVVEPSNTKLYERREGFYRRFIEYDGETFGVRAGNYYTVFGRGLTFSAYEDDVVFLDRDMDGVKIRGSTRWADLVAISGRPRVTEFSQLAYSVTNDTTDVIRGADLSVHPFPFVDAGASYVIMNKRDLFDPLVARRTEVYSANAGLSVSYLDLYGEVARRWGYDPLMLDQSSGYGLYGSMSVAVPGYGVAFQFADYDSIALGGLTYRYNNPPVVNRYGQSLNGGLDETGYQVEGYASPIEQLNLNAGYSDSKTADDTLSFKETYGGLAYERLGLLEVRGEYDRTEQHGIISGAANWEEDIPSLKGTFYLAPYHSVGVEYSHRMVTLDTGAEEEDFIDKKLSLSYTFSPYGTLTLTGEIRDKETEHEPGKEWRSAQVDWDITQNHRLTLTIGSEKGDFVCSGGVCRYEPPFDGVRAILSSTF